MRSPSCASSFLPLSLFLCFCFFSFEPTCFCLPRYHVFGGAGSIGPTNIYVTDPTGDAIQLDGPWTAYPTAGSGDSLMDACSQVTY